MLFFLDYAPNPRYAHIQCAYTSNALYAKLTVIGLEVGLIVRVRVLGSDLTVPESPHQLVQRHLGALARGTAQAAPAARRVNPARLSELQRAHGTAATSRLPHQLRTWARGFRTRRLLLCRTARTAEHDLSAGEGGGGGG